jgi:hypothetical protein
MHTRHLGRTTPASPPKSSYFTRRRQGVVKA